MENNNEENNKSIESQKQKQTSVKPNESIELPLSKNSSKNENQNEKEEQPIENNEIKTDKEINSPKPITEKEDIKDKENDNNQKNNVQNQENNIQIKDLNKDNKEANVEMPNIKYISEKQLEQMKSKQKKTRKNLMNSPDTLITIKDLQNNPNKKLIINSPRSLKALYDSGFSLDQLYYRTLDEFIEEHKEVLHIEEEARINRYYFFEKLRMDKINSLVDYREKLIQDELEQKNYEDFISNNLNNEESDNIKPMKSIILDNDKRIAKEEIDIIKKKHEKELANIIQLELDKDLFNIEMKKQQEIYRKEYQKLNFLNFQSTTEENNNNINNEKKDDEVSEEQKTQTPIPVSERSGIFSNSKNYIKKNYNSISLPKKQKIFVDCENTYLDNLNSLQQTLINQKYEKKKKKVAQKLERLEKIRKITGEQRALKKRIEEERAAQNLQKNAVDFWKKHDELVKEIQDKKIIIFQNKKKFENMTKNRNEWNNLKYIIKMDLIADMKRKDENERMVRYIELMERQSRIERIKNDRSNVVDNKLFQKDYLNSERKKNIVKINDILVNGISEENLDKILNQFPQNKELFKVIQNYKNNKKKLMDSNYNTFKTEKSASIKRPKSHGKLFLENIKSNKRKESGKIEQKEFPNLKIPNLLYTKENNKALTETNKISNESDIKDKIKLYKELLSKQFFQKVQKEKENEEMRLKELEKIEDKNKRYQLEKKFRKERALVFMRLERENQKINEKINMYEFNLKNIDKIDNNNNKI